MKKIFLAFFVCLSCLNVEAESDKKVKKQIGDLYKTNVELRQDLERVNIEIRQIANRSFSTETPEEKIKKRLAWYKDVSTLVGDVKFCDELNKSPLGKTYTPIVEMYLSLQRHGGYQRDKNDYYKNMFESLKHQLSELNPPHKDSFVKSVEEMMTQIKDYRFTMFELVRVFDLVDKKEKAGMQKDNIYKALRDDYETEYTDKIPFTKDLLEKYIKADGLERTSIRERDDFKTIN